MDGRRRKVSQFVEIDGQCKCGFEGEVNVGGGLCGGNCWEMLNPNRSLKRCGGRRNAERECCLWKNSYYHTMAHNFCASRLSVRQIIYARVIWHFGIWYCTIWQIICVSDKLATILQDTLLMQSQQHLFIPQNHTTFNINQSNDWAKWWAIGRHRTQQRQENHVKMMMRLLTVSNDHLQMQPTTL